jgi:hypothetical protein
MARFSPLGRLQADNSSTHRLEAAGVFSSMPSDLLVVVALRVIVLVAGFLLLGQGTLWLFGAKARKGNFVYDLFELGTRPLVKFTRIITPRIIIDKHVPFVTFFILFWIWVGLGIWKIQLCRQYDLGMVLDICRP